MNEQKNDLVERVAEAISLAAQDTDPFADLGKYYFVLAKAAIAALQTNDPRDEQIRVLRDVAYHADILVDVLEDKNFNAVERTMMVNNLKTALTQANNIAKEGV